MFGVCKGKDRMMSETKKEGSEFFRQRRVGLQIVGLGALDLLVGSLLTTAGCRSISLDVPIGFRGKYSTDAHKFLDVEVGHGTKEEHYRILDEFIDEAKAVIQPKTLYTTQDAMEILKSMYNILTSKYPLPDTAEEDSPHLFSQSLTKGKLDCDNYSIALLGIGQALELPIKVASAPGHMFVRFHMSQNEYVNFDPGYDGFYSDNDYRIGFLIPEKSIEKGVYLRSFDSRDVLSSAFEVRGRGLVDRVRRGEGKASLVRQAIKDFTRAIRLDPKNVFAYNNRGWAYYIIDDLDRAITDLRMTIKLNPYHPKAYTNLSKVFTEMGEADLAKMYESLGNLAEKMYKAALLTLE